jgi:predicted CopG family antitoxin
MSKTISIPEDLYNRLENEKAPRQPFSGVIEGLLEESR